VSTTEEILRVRLLDAKKAEVELRAVRREEERVSGVTLEHGRSSSEAAEGHHRLSGALGGLKNALMYGGGLIGLAGVGYGLKDITEGGIQAQERQLLLQQALKQTGQAGSKHLGELNAAVQRTSSSGGFGPLEEKEGLAGLIRETKNTTLAIRDNREAIMLARGAHEEYGAALSQVERIETGQVGRLQKYLGIIQPVKYYVDQLTASEKKRFPEKLKEAELLDKEATAREANRRILERYGGAVNAYNKSTAGSISNANNAFKEATEQLGEKLLPAETAVAKEFTKLIREISKGEGVWKTVGHDISEVWKDLEGVYHFLEQHKDLAKLLGYGAALGAGTKLLPKVPGVSLSSKLLKVATSGPAEGAEGAAAAEAGGLTLGASLATVGGSYLLLHEVVKGTEKGVHGLTLASGGGGSPLGAKERRLLAEEVAKTRAFERTGRPQDEGQRMELAEQQAEAREARHAKAIQEAVERGMASHGHDLYLDGQKLGQALVHNRHLRRGVAEANAKQTQERRARE
jgi:hypothetical protein